MYVYVGNNPVNYVDPTGHFTVFLPGFNSTVGAPYFQDFLAGLHHTSPIKSEVDYWQFTTRKNHVGLLDDEWTRHNTAMSDSVANFLEVLSNAEDHINPDQPHTNTIIGYSFGGTVAANAALKMHDDGYKVDLIFIGSPVDSHVLQQLDDAGIHHQLIKNHSDDVPVVGLDSDNGDATLGVKTFTGHGAEHYFGQDTLQATIDTANQMLADPTGRWRLR